MSDHSRQRRSPIFREGEAAAPGAVIRGRTRRIPLTPAMRDAFSGHASMVFQQLLAITVSLMVVFALFFGLVSLVDRSMVILAICVPFGLGGLLLALGGPLFQRYQRQRARAVASGAYVLYEGPYRVTEEVFRNQRSFYFHVDGMVLRHESAVSEKDEVRERLLSTQAGTLLYLPSNNHLLAAWDRQDRFLYTALDYDIARDPDAVRPAGTAIPRATTAPSAPAPLAPATATGRSARWAVVVDPLSRNTRAVFALGVTFLAIALVAFIVWSVFV